MENISQNINKFLKSKHFFAFLCVLLFLATYLLVKKEVLVKGESSRALPVLVWIDNERKTIQSSSSVTDQILRDGNINVYPEDIVETSIILDPVRDGGAGQKVAIKRAPVFFVEADGRKIEVRNWDNKVSSLLSKSGLSLGAKDQISSNVNSVITPGSVIVVTRINEADVDIFEDVAFETIQKADSSVPFGTKKVTQSGSNGKNKKTYRIRYKNGVEVSRKLIATSSVSPVVNKIVTSGSITGRANFGYYSGMVTSFYKGMTGKYLLVTNNANGKQVKVKIIGSGPFNGPIMDMGTEPFQAIGGKLSSGYLSSVTVQLVD